MRNKEVNACISDVCQHLDGLLNQVEKVSSMFLNDGQTIVKFEERARRTNEVIASKKLDNGFKVNEPTVVLVDKDSASASEIVTVAFKESGNKQTIGTSTYGMGTLQSIKELTDKSEVVCMEVGNT